MFKQWALDVGVWEAEQVLGCDRNATEILGEHARGIVPFPRSCAILTRPTAQLPVTRRP
jgi:hypothetical protein